jgi:hypothetical protein
MAAEEEAVELEVWQDEEDSIDEPRKLYWWIRILLVALMVPWLAVFAVATQISPYEQGQARRMGTHMQLGLPDCSFKEWTGRPCPSCGMTTSFCLLIRGDVWHSLQANFAGTLLATFGLLFLPWAFASAFLGRIVLIRSIELVVFWLAMIFLVLLFGRWIFVLIWGWLMEA